MREFDVNDLPEFDRFPDDPPLYNSPLKLLEDGKQLAICHMGFRFDSYLGWCGHVCSYCYARGIDLRFKRYNYVKIKVANLEDIKNRFNKIFDLKKEPQSILEKCIAHKYPIRAGTNTDCFQQVEKKYRITYKFIDEIMNVYDYPYTICTKSKMVADPEYLELYKDNVNFQFSLATLNKDYHDKIERGTPLPKIRLKAMEKLSKNGYFVGCRISPFVPELMGDTEELIKNLADVGCRHVITELLRVSPILNKIMKEDSGIDFAENYKSRGVKLNLGFWRYPLEEKINHQKRIKELCDKYGLTFATCGDEDPSFHTVKNCCGFDNEKKFKGIPSATYDTAFRLCKKNGKVTFDDLTKDNWTPNPEKLKEVWNKGYFENVVKFMEFNEEEKSYHYTDCNPTLKRVNQNWDKS